MTPTRGCRSAPNGWSGWSSAAARSTTTCCRTRSEWASGARRSCGWRGSTHSPTGRSGRCWRNTPPPPTSSGRRRSPGTWGRGSSWRRGSPSSCRPTGPSATPAVPSGRAPPWATRTRTPPSRPGSSGTRSAASGYCSVRREERPLGYLPHDLLDSFREMVPVVKQEYPARAPREQKGEERHVRLRGVAGGTGEDQVVRPVVRGLPLPGPDMVEGHVIDRNGPAAVGADRTVLREQPVAVGLVRPPAGSAQGLGSGVGRRFGAALAGLAGHECGVNTVNPTFEFEPAAGLRRPTTDGSTASNLAALLPFVIIAAPPRLPPGFVFGSLPSPCGVPRPSLERSPS